MVCHIWNGLASYNTCNIPLEAASALMGNLKTTRRFLLEVLEAVLVLNYEASCPVPISTKMRRDKLIDNAPYLQRSVDGEYKVVG